MFTLLAVSIAPGFALLSFFYLKERLSSEPIGFVLRCFIFGALLVFPIMFIQYVFKVENIGQSPFFSSFVLSGLLEEFFKWFIFLYTVYKHTSFDKPYDGIVYGVAISLGFATVENLLYLLANGVNFAIGRAIFPVSSHALLGVILGFYMGKAKFMSQQSARKWIGYSLLIPVILHGSYDLVLEIIKENWMLALTPFMIYLWWIALRKVKIANSSNILQPNIPTQQSETQ
ncbi:glutamic-type intramembrane protease PrsW [Bacillaceae bacterium S4-13-58]